MEIKENAMRVAVLTAIFSMFASALFAEEVSVSPYVAQVDGDGYQRVELVGGDYYFKPSHIVVKVKEPVKFIVRKKSGLIPHNIVMDAPEAGLVFRMDIHGEGTVITFIPGKTGRFAFYCDKRFLFFKSHREKGMEGILEVVE
jgi:plastocyanin